MPSILPDYEYDIFISYRQNDNKRGSWVSIYQNIRNEPQFQLYLEEAKVIYDERIKKYGHLFEN